MIVAYSVLIILTIVFYAGGAIYIFLEIGRKRKQIASLEELIKKLDELSNQSQKNRIEIEEQKKGKESLNK